MFFGSFRVFRCFRNKKICVTPFGLSLRREWGLAPLCGAVATFSGYSKDPSRPVLGYLALSGHEAMTCYDCLQ